MLAQHQYKDALPYAQRILSAYQLMLPKHSATLAMYNLKVGTIHWHLQEIEQAIKTLADAAHGLEITHGPDHNMYKDCTGRAGKSWIKAKLICFVIRYLFSTFFLITMIQQCQQESCLDKFAQAKIRAARAQMGQNIAIDINEALKDQDI